jgi:hypothetical protein
MKVCELVDLLKELPQEAGVFCLWDGLLRGSVDVAWKARNGRVVLAKSGEVVYSTATRPETAPTSEEFQFWEISR